MTAAEQLAALRALEIEDEVAADRLRRAEAIVAPITAFAFEYSNSDIPTAARVAVSIALAVIDEFDRAAAFGGAARDVRAAAIRARACK